MLYYSVVISYFGSVTLCDKLVLRGSHCNMRGNGFEAGNSGSDQLVVGDWVGGGDPSRFNLRGGDEIRSGTGDSLGTGFRGKVSSSDGHDGGSICDGSLGDRLVVHHPLRQPQCLGQSDDLSCDTRSVDGSIRGGGDERFPGGDDWLGLVGECDDVHHRGSYEDGTGDLDDGLIVLVLELCDLVMDPIHWSFSDDDSVLLILTSLDGCFVLWTRSNTSHDATGDN